MDYSLDDHIFLTNLKIVCLNVCRYYTRGGYRAYRITLALINIT
jgi:hypothetical protein